MTSAPASVSPGQGRHHPPWALVAILAAVAIALFVALLAQLGVLGGSSGSQVAPASTTVGSGVSATQSRTLPAFDGVELAGSNEVVVHVGEKQSVLVRADDNLLDRVTTHVRSGVLVVGTTPGDMQTKTPMTVEVAVPSLDQLTLSGSGTIVVDSIATRRLDVSIPGSGTITGSGTATRLDADVSGSGAVKLTRLVAQDVRAAVSGSGAVFVTATRSLDGSVSGSGAIVYTGSPQQVTRSVTGSGAITGA